MTIKTKSIQEFFGANLVESNAQNTFNGKSYVDLTKFTTRVPFLVKKTAQPKLEPGAASLTIEIEDKIFLIPIIITLKFDVADYDDFAWECQPVLDPSISYNTKAE